MKKNALSELVIALSRYTNKKMFERLVSKTVRSIPESENLLAIRLIENTGREMLKQLMASNNLSIFGLPTLKLREFNIAVKVAKQLKHLSNIVGVQTTDTKLGLISVAMYTEIAEILKDGKKSKAHKLAIETRPVSARIRTLQFSQSTIEMLGDIDHDTEKLEDEIAEYVVNTITQHVISKITTVAKEIPVHIDQMQHATLATGSVMGVHNRRGRANMMLMNEATFQKFCNKVQRGLFQTADLQCGPFRLVGSFDRSIKVFVSNFVKNDSILLGYRGGDFDAGVFYVPYVPFITDGYTVSSEFESTPLFTILHNTFLIEKKSRYGGAPSDYYNHITIFEELK